MTGKNFATQSKMPTEVKLLPSHRKGDRSAISPDIYVSKDGSQVLEKDIPGS